MMVYKCDRCGKIILRPNENHPTHYVLAWGESKYDDPNDGGTVEQIDICASCWESFHQWLARWQTDKKEIN